MTAEQFTNLAQTTLVSSIAAGATSLTIVSANSFPTGGNFRIVIDQEIFWVTAISGTSLTVLPGYEGTTQASHSSGAAVAHVMTAGAITQIYNNALNFATPRIQAFGDSRASYCGLNVNATSSSFTNPSIRYPSNSPLSWANRFLRGKLNFDLSQGYVGQFQGVCSVKVVNGGTNYTAPTVSFSGFGSGLTFGTPVLSNGSIISVPVTTQGINFTSLPTLSVSDSTGSGAQLQAIVGGTGTFGVAGETTTQCINRLADIIAAPVDIVFICIGTNDLTNGISAATTKANLQTIFDTLIAAGKFVVYCPDQARSFWPSFMTSTQILDARRQYYSVKRWAYQYALLVNGKNSNTNKRILICDGEDFWVDATSATGDPLAGMTSDGLHWSVTSAQAMGLRLANALKPLLGLDGPAYNIVSQADVHDSIYNPDGALNFGWLMNVTPLNTPTSPLTGNLAGDWNAFRSQGSATGAMAASIETTRTDGLSGNRQVFNFAIGNGTSSELYNFGITSSVISAFGISAGMTVIAECDMWLSNQHNVNVLSLQLNFIGSGAIIFQDWDGDVSASLLVNSGAPMAIKGDSTPMSFKTPPAVVPVGADHLTCYAIIGFDASGGTNSATATWKIGNFKIRQIA